VQLQVRRLDRELERTEGRLSNVAHGSARPCPVAQFAQALAAAKTRASGLDERIAVAAADVQGLNKQIEAEQNLQMELNLTIENARKQSPPPLPELQKGYTECTCLLKNRLYQIEATELLLAYYQKRTIRRKGDLQLIPKYQKEVAQLRQAIERLRGQIAPGKAVDRAEAKIHEQMDADELSVLKQLDARDRALLSRVRDLLTQLVKLRLPIPPQPERVQVDGSTLS
jgi:hypothetical protein